MLTDVVSASVFDAQSRVRQEAGEAAGAAFAAGLCGLNTFCACLRACLAACLPACYPACILPACLLPACSLSCLQDNVPPFETQTALRILEDNLGAPAGEIFAEFDEVPIAAASLGQVRSYR